MYIHMESDCKRHCSGNGGRSDDSVIHAAEQRTAARRLARECPDRRSTTGRSPRVEAGRCRPQPRRRAPRHRCCPACRTCTATPSSAAWPGWPRARGPSADSFWTWREVMYRFALSMTPDEVEAVAAQALCRDAGGRLHPRRRVPLPAPRPRRPPLRQHRRDGERIAAAASRHGHRPDAAAGLLRAFRLSAARRPNEGQRRFINDLDGFARLLDGCREAVASLVRTRSSASRRTACAP